MQLRNILLFTTVILTLLLGTWTAHAADSSHDKSVLERNKAEARRVYEEGLNQGIFNVRYTKDFIGHGGSRKFTHEDSLRETRGWRKAFPDLKMNVDFMVAEGDLVTVRWTATGTNTGTGLGIPATGRSIKTSGTAIFRFVDGAVAEEWIAGDALGTFRQLGITPPMGNPSE